MPDSVVDWVVLEFRNVNSGESKYINCILKQDGSIVDPITDTSVVLNEKGVYAGLYQVGVLHRNHLPVYTEEYFRFSAHSTTSKYFDFTKPDIIMGRFNSTRALYLTQNNDILFGMKAGDVNQDGIIGIYKPGTLIFDMADYNQGFDHRNIEGYSIWDINMDGIVTSRDLNYILNNLGSQTSK